MMNEREKAIKEMMNEIFGDNKTPDTKNERNKVPKSLLESNHKEGTPIETLFTPEVVEKLQQIDKQFDELGKLMSIDMEDPHKLALSDDYSKFQFVSVIESIKDARINIGSCIFMLESSKQHVDLLCKEVGSSLEDLLYNIIIQSVLGE